MLAGKSRLSQLPGAGLQDSPGAGVPPVLLKQSSASMQLLILVCVALVVTVVEVGAMVVLVVATVVEVVAMVVVVVTVVVVVVVVTHTMWRWSHVPLPSHPAVVQPSPSVSGHGVLFGFAVSTHWPV